MTDRRVLLLEQAYQGRAMFVKVSCKAGESPVELSHHPELRFRLIPRPHDGAPLIANAVQFEVRLARTRAKCEANGMKSTHPPARKTFSFFATSDATTNERRLTPRLTHDPSARALLTNARSTFRARVVHDRHAMRLSC